MNTAHFWFRSGNYSLPGHLDVARQKRGYHRGYPGIVIVPPFGWEEVCSYRPLRFMAQAFARAGMPALRYDLPGTGDSSGDARDPRLLDSWIQSVADAVEELRRNTGVEKVAVVGIRLGGMLAMTAASRGANFRQMVLWGASARGHTVLRELRAAANIERGEYLSEDEAPPQPIPGFEAGGFLIAPETLDALEEMDMASLTWPRPVRALLLSRDSLPHDAQLTALLKASVATVETGTGEGYAAMMSTPQEALVPADTIGLIAEYLTRNIRKPTKPIRFTKARSTAVEHLRNEFAESVYPIETPSLGMFGILTEPAPGVPRSDYCLLFLNAGGVRHTGPNRMWVEAARRWAARGVASLRFDVQGIGESDGEHYVAVADLYRNRLVDEVEVAINSLRRRTSAGRIGAIGLCSGACWAFHAALRNPRVHSAILLNPSLLWWDPGADRRRILRSVASGFTPGGFNGWADWTRMVRSGIQRRDIQRAAYRMAERLGRTRMEGSGHLELGFETLSEAWRSLERNQKRVTLVFREGEPLLAEMEASGQLPSDTNSFVRCVRIPNGGHTLRPLWAQKIAHDVIDAELAAAIRADARAGTITVAGRSHSGAREPAYVEEVKA